MKAALFSTELKQISVSLAIVLILTSRTESAQADVSPPSEETRGICLTLTQRRIKKHFDAIFSETLREGRRFQIDPVLLISIIEVESGFSEKRHGRFGEIGLMQLKPTTAEWIARKMGIPWKGAQSLEDPATNIELGAAYLCFLRTQMFFQKQLYLSAYNMGISNVQKALRRQIIPKDYALRVLKRYQKYASNLEVPNQEL